MANKTKKKQPADIALLFNTLDHLDEQGKVLRQTVEVVFEIKKEVESMKVDINRDVKELRDSITINRHEQFEIKSSVGKKAADLTNELFKGKASQDLYSAKYGHFTKTIYKRLKDTFGLATYTDLKRIDFEKALVVIDIVELSNLQPYQIRLTDSQKKIAERNNDLPATVTWMEK